MYFLLFIRTFGIKINTVREYSNKRRIFVYMYVCHSFPLVFFFFCFSCYLTTCASRAFFSSSVRIIESSHILSCPTFSLLIVQLEKEMMTPFSLFIYSSNSHSSLILCCVGVYVPLNIKEILFLINQLKLIQNSILYLFNNTATDGPL